MIVEKCDLKEKIMEMTLLFFLGAVVVVLAVLVLATVVVDSSAKYV